MVKKAAVGRSKSPPLAVKKTVACSGSPKRARKKRCYISTRNKLITFCIFLCEYKENIEAHVTSNASTLGMHTKRNATL